jgi:hypothetical protein
VVDDDNGVAREVDVQLQAVGARGQAEIEGLNRILRGELASAPVGENKRPGGRHSRMHQQMVDRPTSIVNSRSSPSGW